MSLKSIIDKSESYLRKKFTSQDDISSFSKILENLFLEYSKYVAIDYRDMYSEYMKELIETAENEGFSKFEQIIPFVKNKKKDGKGYNDILSSLIAGYLQKILSDELIINKGLIEEVNIKKNLIEEVKKKGYVNSTQIISAIDRMVTPIDLSEDEFVIVQGSKRSIQENKCLK